MGQWISIDSPSYLSFVQWDCQKYPLQFECIIRVLNSYHNHLSYTVPHTTLSCLCTHNPQCILHNCACSDFGISTCIFLRKVAFLSKLFCQNKDCLCSRIFTSLAIENVYNTSIVQQCRMLESQLETIVAKCLHDPENATSIVQSSIKDVLRKDYDKLLSESLSHHPSTKLVATVAVSSSWRWLSNMALDRGVKGAHSTQFFFKKLSRPCTGERLCNLKCVTCKCRSKLL